MITGDHPQTALEIARQLGIADSNVSRRLTHLIMTELPTYIGFEEYSEHVPASIPSAVQQATTRFISGRAARVAELPQWEELRQIGEALRMGMNMLAHMRDMKTAAFPMNAIIVRRSFLEKNRDAVKRFQQAYAEATRQFQTNKEKALAILAKRMQQKNPKAIEETYQYVAPGFSFPTRISHQGLRNTLEMAAQRTPGAKPETNLEKFLDEGTLDELEREGFFKRLGGKG